MSTQDENQNNYDIIIDVENSTDAKALTKEDGIIHQFEFAKATKFINSKIERAEKIKNEEDLENEYLDTITILGTRGSGKTSFLKSLMYQYKENDKVCILDIIDPTLIEDKMHVFLTLISMIKEQVDNTLKNEACNPQSDKYLKKKKWSQDIYKLSDGLVSMDGVGGDLTNLQWQDPEYVMNKGLQSVDSSRKLSKLFKSIVFEGLNIIEKKVFLIAFDDIDINFKKGWSVLETIRKYLTTPQVIILLSGDMRLYSLAIRERQWDNLGKALLKYEAKTPEKQTYFRDFITELEGQYLQKVIKPAYRIHLNTLSEKLNSPFNDYEYYFKAWKYDKDKKKRILTITNIADYYKYVLSRFGIKNEYQSEVYITFLLGLPLRTQFMFLSEFNKERNPLIQLNITEAFLSYLLEKRVEISLANSAPKFLNIIILEFLVREKILREGYQLQPSLPETSQNACLISLSLLLSKYSLITPYLIFDYFIKIGYSRNMLSILNHRNDNEKNVNGGGPSIEGLCKYACVMQDKVLRDITALMTGYVQYAVGNKRFNTWAGIVNFPIQGKKQYNLEDMIKNVSRGSKRIIVSIPACTYKKSNNSAQQTYSFYNLLATIGELTRSISGDSFYKRILDLSQVKSYSLPEIDARASESLQRYDPTEETEHEYENEWEGIINELKDLEVLMNEWIVSQPYKTITPHLLGKISTRTFYAFDDIKVYRVNHLNYIMQAFTIAFLNSVLIEEIKENIKNTNHLDVRNSTISPRIFLKNLNNFKNSLPNLPYFTWMLSCPLLLTFIGPHYIDQINEIHKIKNLKGILEFSVYSILHDIVIDPQT